MSARHRSIVSATAAAALIFWLQAGAAGAQRDRPPGRYDEPKPQVELFLSSLFANSTSEGSFGLRGAHPLARRFALEGSLSRLTDERVDLWLVDLSAKFYLKDEGRTDVYLLAGPGLFYSDDLDANEPMLHLGLGAELELGRRFYFRPELRGRWFVDDVDSDTLFDVSAGFGWRF